MKVVDARAAYFARTGFSSAAYEERWVRVKVGPIPVAFPNVASRRRAIRYHDLHHILTGYDTSWRGESQIAAWEIASTLRARRSMGWAAFVLDGGALVVGMLIAPLRTLRAFRRGWRSHTLYGTNVEDVLHLDVDELRARLGLAR